MKLALLLAVAFALAAQTASDPLKDLKAKELDKRLAAIDAAAALPPDKSRKALFALVTDRDWEVVEHALRALERVGDRSMIPELIELAVDGPIQRIRTAASIALAQIDADRAIQELVPRTDGKHPVQAFEAVAEIAIRSETPIANSSLLKAVYSARKGKDLRAQVAAARVWIATSEPESELNAWLVHERLECRAAALETAARKASPFALTPLARMLVQPNLNPVLERRVIAALVTAFDARVEAPGAANTRAVERSLGWGDVAANFDKLRDPATQARWVRLAAALASPTRAKAKIDRVESLRVIEAALAHPSPVVRAAACAAATSVHELSLAPKLAALAAGDAAPRVRRAALDSAVKLATLADHATLEACVNRLANDADGGVREDAAVLLGVDGAKDAVAPLAAALSDREWNVCACAAVSLGMTRDPGALAPLAALAKDADWRRRGGALVGLERLYTPPCTPIFIQALTDSEPTLAHVAYGFLKHVSGEKFPAEVAPWQKWWDEHQSKVVFVPPEELRARLERYGYKSDDEPSTAADPKATHPNLTVAYENLDVLVFVGRPGGDNIQTLFQRLGIQHRTTQANRIAADAPQPDGIYVANCPGEIEVKDVERLQWFVRVGGYLFSSCWALHETIERVYPGVVRKFETSSEVVDDVPAQACVEASDYLKGVFNGGVVPIYKLEGAHLIEVLEPERCEVLIDSPACAAKWGSGELAAWFRAGHGLILDSANHFDLQGLEDAPGLKTPADRIAYAFDHMGLAYAEWRKTRDEKWWSSNNSAAKQVVDLSAFRFLTNFVRQKRIGNE